MNPYLQKREDDLELPPEGAQFLDEEEDYSKDRNRDNWHRCKQCLELHHIKQCILDDDKGYLCPNGCVAPFIQPNYEDPFNGSQDN